MNSVSPDVRPGAVVKALRTYISFPFVLVALAVAGLCYLVLDGGLRDLWHEWRTR